MNYTGIRVVSSENAKVNGIVGAITDYSANLLNDTEYILQFKIINYSHHNILDHIVAIKDGLSNIITNNLNILDFPIVNIFNDEGMTKNERLCYIKFTPPSDGEYRFGICRTFQEGEKPNTVLFDVRHVSCERGIVLQDFKDNSNDLVNFMKRCETYFEQNDKRILMMAKQEDINTTSAKIDLTSENILLEVNKKVGVDNIIASINLSPELIKLNADRIDMTGSLDLNGTFKCYRDGSNKTGHYLYQSGAMHRGYLEGKQYPTFSSGIWKPDGINDMGYVSVGWTNSDNIDENGCLWISPIVGGGGQLIYSKLLSAGVGDVSGIMYNKSGYVDYIASIAAVNSDDTIMGHQFDCGISTNSYFRGEGIYSYGNVFTVSFENQPHHLYAVNFQNEGYVYPNGNTQLGTSLNPFYQLVCTHAPEVVSDRRKKTNIQYVDEVNTLSSKSSNLTKDDMYNFVKDDLKLATYQLINNREEHSNKIDIGIMVQDIKDTKVGKYIVNVSDEDNYTYDMANRISVLEGALQKAIEKIEILTNMLDKEAI